MVAYESGNQRKPSGLQWDLLPEDHSWKRGLFLLTGLHFFRSAQVECQLSHCATCACGIWEGRGHMHVETTALKNLWSNCVWERHMMCWMSSEVRRWDLTCELCSQVFTQYLTPSEEPRDFHFSMAFPLWFRAPYFEKESQCITTNLTSCSTKMLLEMTILHYIRKDIFDKPCSAPSFSLLLSNTILVSSRRFQKSLLKWVPGKERWSLMHAQNSKTGSWVCFFFLFVCFLFSIVASYKADKLSEVSST